MPKGIRYDARRHPRLNAAVHEWYHICREIEDVETAEDKAYRLCELLPEASPEAQMLIVRHILGEAPRKCPDCRLMRPPNKMRADTCKVCAGDERRYRVPRGWRQRQWRRQHGRCALCHEQMIAPTLYSAGRGPDYTGGEIDHDPAFGSPPRNRHAVRGLICPTCNGKLKDLALDEVRSNAASPVARPWWALALAYLERYETHRIGEALACLEAYAAHTAWYKAVPHIR